MSYGYYNFGYTSVADKKQKAQKLISKLIKQGKKINPVKIEGRKIAKTFWGKSWCDNLLSYSDYSNRLPRGSAYVKNGFVLDLQIFAGKVTSLVAGTGSNPYKIEIKIEKLSKKKWGNLKKKCVGKIDSLIELLQGKLSDKVLEIIIDKKSGIFPSPKEISLDCSCPDWATMCKHIAATLYAVGARLDEKPELFFVLRGVDYNELVENIDTSNAIAKTVEKGKDENFDDMDVAAVFGIEIATTKDTKNTKKKVRTTKEKLTTKDTKNTKKKVRTTKKKVRTTKKKATTTKKKATTKNTKITKKKVRTTKKKLTKKK